MYWKTAAVAGLVVLVAVAARPEVAEARGGGGGHFGGAHFSGGHFGGGHFGAAHLGHGQFGPTHFGPAHFGGVNHLGFRPATPFGTVPFPRAHAGVPFGAVPFRGNAIPNRGFVSPFVGHRGHLPYFAGRHHYYFGSPFGAYGWGSGGYSPYSNPYDFASIYDAPYGSGYGDYASGYGDYLSNYSGADGYVADTATHVTIQVPPDARLWVNGVLTSPTGPIRYLDSPALTPGVAYQYLVQARWNENGHEVTQTQQVAVAAGTSLRVTFPIPPSTGQRQDKRSRAQDVIRLAPGFLSFQPARSHGPLANSARRINSGRCPA